MHLTNYKIGYIPTFACTIHGTIRMTQKEWETVYPQIYKYATQDKKHAYNLAPMLRRDVERKIFSQDKRSYYINIRVPLTEYLVQTFKLPHYRRGNYRIKIVTTLFDA